MLEIIENHWNYYLEEQQRGRVLPLPDQQAAFLGGLQRLFGAGCDDARLSLVRWLFSRGVVRHAFGISIEVVYCIYESKTPNVFMWPNMVSIKTTLGLISGTGTKQEPLWWHNLKQQCFKPHTQTDLLKTPHTHTVGGVKNVINIIIILYRRVDLKCPCFVSWSCLSVILTLSSVR